MIHYHVHFKHWQPSCLQDVSPYKEVTACHTESAISVQPLYDIGPISFGTFWSSRPRGHFSNGQCDQFKHGKRDILRSCRESQCSYSLSNKGWFYRFQQFSRSIPFRRTLLIHFLHVQFLETILFPLQRIIHTIHQKFQNCTQLCSLSFVFIIQGKNGLYISEK